MARGHVTGHKTERTGASDWYKAIEEENLKRIEAAWQAQQHGKEPVSRCVLDACSGS